MRVLFLPEVSQQFIELAEILFDKGYVNFLDTALEYSASLFKDIQASLPMKVHRKAPTWFDRFGQDMFVYLVRYMSNNHVIAQHLELDS